MKMWKMGLALLLALSMMLPAYVEAANAPADEIEEILSDMTLEQKVGQMMISSPSVCGRKFQRKNVKTLRNRKPSASPS